MKLKTKSMILATCMLAIVTTFISCKKEEKPNVHIKRSNELTLGDFKYNSQYKYYYTTVHWTELSAEIIDKGAVMLYEKLDGGHWVSWNYSLDKTNYTFSAQQGSLELLIENGDGTAPTDPKGMVIKMVALSETELKRHPDADPKHYLEVKPEYNTKD